MSPSNPDRKPPEPSKRPSKVYNTQALYNVGFPQLEKDADALPQKTLEEMNIKRFDFIELHNLVHRKITELRNKKNTEATIKTLSKVKEDARKKSEELELLIKEEQKRELLVKQAVNEFDSKLREAEELPDRAEKKEALRVLINVIRGSRGHMKARKDEIAEVLSHAQENFNVLEREDISEELRIIREADEAGDSARELDERVDELLEKAKSPGLEEVLAEIQKTKSDIQEELKADNARKAEIARAVRHAGTKVRYHLERAALSRDLSIRKGHLVEAIHVLQAAVVLGGALDEDRVDALRAQFNLADDAVYRCFLLDFVVARPLFKVTIKNFDKEMKNIPEVPVAKSKEGTPTKKNQEFVIEGRKIANHAEPGDRMEGYKSLLRKIKAENNRDKRFAVEYGNDLERDIADDLKRCFQVVVKMLKTVGQKGNADDSNAQVSLLHEWYTKDEGDSKELDSRASQVWQGLSSKYNELVTDVLENDEDPPELAEDEPAPVRERQKSSRILLAALLVTIATAVGIKKNAENGGNDGTAVTSSSTTGAPTSASVNPIPSTTPIKPTTPVTPATPVPPTAPVKPTPVTPTTPRENTEQIRKQALAHFSAGLTERLNHHGLTVEQCRAAIASWEKQPESARRGEELALWRKHERRLLALERIQEVVKKLEAGIIMTTRDVREAMGTGPEDAVLTELTHDLDDLIHLVH